MLHTLRAEFSYLRRLHEVDNFITYAAVRNMYEIKMTAITEKTAYYQFKNPQKSLNETTLSASAIFFRDCLRHIYGDLVKVEIFFENRLLLQEPKNVSPA